MKIKVLVSVVLLMAAAHPLSAQEEAYRYMRGSLCMMMVENPLSEYKPEIKAVYEAMDMPNRFNDHRFGKVRVIKFPNRADMVRNLQTFAKENEIGKRLVGKWFGHNKAAEAFNTDEVRERGLDNATKIDIAEALKTIRGKAMLEDMGENLISHTYWVVTDFDYRSHKNAINIATDAIKVMEGGLKVASGGLNKVGTMLKDDKDNLSHSVGDLFEDYEGFKMKVKSYLFRLDWNEEIANTFYTQYYTEDAQQDADKLQAFKNDKSLFNVTFVGQMESSSTKVSAFGLKTKEQLIDKICRRALDKNLAELQHKFADFRIKAPLVSTTPLKAYVGMKEDITPQSRYEVLVPQKDERGITKYKRMGVIKPVKGQIWDNQYMADLEGTEASKLDATYFETVSGGNFAEGMLIREIK